MLIFLFLAKALSVMKMYLFCINLQREMLRAVVEKREDIQIDQDAMMAFVMSSPDFVRVRTRDGYILMQCPDYDTAYFRRENVPSGEREEMAAMRIHFISRVVRPAVLKYYEGIARIVGERRRTVFKVVLARGWFEKGLGYVSPKKTDDQLCFGWRLIGQDGKMVQKGDSVIREVVALMRENPYTPSRKIKEAKAALERFGVELQEKENMEAAMDEIEEEQTMWDEEQAEEKKDEEGQ